MRSRQDELKKVKLQLEAEKAAREIKHVDAELVKSYAADLKHFLDEVNVVESKAFLRSFVKIKRVEIEIDGENAKVHYILRMPPDAKIREPHEVLPMVTPGGEGGTRTPTPSKAHDPKSCSSANSDTSPIENHLIQ
jgi:hypothetical protein